MPRADLDKQPGDVAAMFDAIAGRYDLLNDLLSAGQVRLWRRAVARITGAAPGDRVLDLAAGTATSALSFTASGADCVACDFSFGMLSVGALGTPAIGTVQDRDFVQILTERAPDLVSRHICARRSRLWTVRSINFRDCKRLSAPVVVVRSSMTSAASVVWSAVPHRASAVNRLYCSGVRSKAAHFF